MRREVGRARIALRQGGASLAALGGTAFPALALLYAALFGAFGTVSPFMPSFLVERGLGPQSLGAVLAAGTLVRIATGPLLGVAADRLGTRAVLAVAALAAGTIGLLYLPASGFAGLVAVSMAHALAITGLNPLADTLALASSARDRAYPYGWVRGLGSAAFVLATLASGLLVARAGLASIIGAASVLFLAMLPAIPLLPPVAVPAAGQPGGRRDEGIAATLAGALATPAFRAALVVGGLVIGSQSMSDTFAVIHWQAAGIGSGAISALLAEAVCSEIVVFLLVGPRLLRRFGPAGCAALSAMAGALRWTVFAETTAVAALALSELLQGFTFALMHLACMAVIASDVPPRYAATAQTLYGVLSLGLASATVTLASGAAYARFGGQGFLLMTGLCLVALPAAPAMRRRAV